MTTLQNKTDGGAVQFEDTDMGVKTLWNVLECCGERLSDSGELRGRRLAVDLAGWVVQNSQCKAMSQGKVAKPHLRNVFFRTAALLALGAAPIFVLDGEAPELKRETLAQRSETGEAKSLSRARLKALMNECRFLLQALGLKCISASGEGEALCAALDAAGLVDAVVTDDSDAFCYGAKVVWRNFTVSANSISVERVTTHKLSSALSLTRDRLVLAAVLLGCDFFPSGVNGVGKETVLQLLSGWKPWWDALAMMRHLVDIKFECIVGNCRQCSDNLHCKSCASFRRTVCSEDCICMILGNDKKMTKIENSVRKRCLAVGMDWWVNFYPRIIREFYAVQKINPESADFQVQGCPQFKTCMSVLVKKLCWTEEYAEAKLLPLITRWQVKHAAAGGFTALVNPVEILKTRILAGEQSLSVRWKWSDKDHDEDFESIVPLAAFQAAYPALYRTFEESRSRKTKKKVVSKENKAPICPSQQQPITDFFTQKKAVRNPTCVMSQAENLPLRSPPTPEDSDEDCSDLSDIIMDIVSDKKPVRAVETPPLPPSSTFATSTPVGRGVSRRSSRDKPERVFKHSLNGGCGEILDDFEDSFDRMCL